jgi:hypothetical protein
MAFDHINIKCVACNGQKLFTCPDCKGTGKRGVDIHYTPVSSKPFSEEEYELIMASMKQMFRDFRGEDEETTPPSNFIVNRARKTGEL